MSDGKHTQDAFEQRVSGLLRTSASDLDATTSAQLARARRAALQAAGVRIGQDYPAPLVDLAESRAAALAAYKAI